MTLFFLKSYLIFFTGVTIKSSESASNGLTRMNHLSANRSQPEKIAEAFFLGVLLMVAFHLNIAICQAMIFPYRLKTPSNLFPFSLAVASLFLTILHTPYTMASVIMDRWPFNNAWCQTSGMLINLLSMASNFSIVTIAIHRYYLIVEPLYATISLRLARKIVAFVWFTSFVTAIPPLFGWNSYRYAPGKAFCTVDWQDGGPSLVYSFYLMTVSFLVPFGILMYIYRAIYLKTKRQRMITDYNTLQGLHSEHMTAKPTERSRTIYQKLVSWVRQRRRNSQYSVSSPSTSERGNISSPATSVSLSLEASNTIEKEKELKRKKEALKRTLTRQSSVYEQKTVQSAFLLLTTFLVILSPYYIVGIWSGLSQSSPSTVVDFIVTYIFVSMAAVNPILYGFFNRHIRRAVLKSVIGQLACQVCRCCNGDSGIRGSYPVNERERRYNGLESDRWLFVILRSSPPKAANFHQPTITAFFFSMKRRL